MKTVNLVITQDHIDQGKPGQALECVGALALRDLFGQYVSFYNVGFRVDRVEVDAPVDLFHLGSAFDQGPDDWDKYHSGDNSYDAIVRPRTIVLELPDEIAALIPEPQS